MKLIEKMNEIRHDEDKITHGLLVTFALGMGAIMLVARPYLRESAREDRQKIAEELETSLQTAGFPDVAFPVGISLSSPQQHVELGLEDCTINAIAHEAKDESEEPFTYSISMNDGVVAYEFGSYDELLDQLPAGSDFCTYFAAGGNKEE